MVHHDLYRQQQSESRARGRARSERVAQPQAQRLFEITNTAGGAFNGFVFRFTSTAADFTFNGNQPTGGTIDSATVFDAEFDVVAQITNIPNSQLVIVWGSTKNFGAFTGLASLFGDFLPDSFVGSTVADRLTSFTIGDTLRAAAAPMC